MARINKDLQKKLNKMKEKSEAEGGGSSGTIVSLPKRRGGCSSAYQEIAWSCTKVIRRYCSVLPSQSKEGCNGYQFSESFRTTLDSNLSVFKERTSGWRIIEQAVPPTDHEAMGLLNPNAVQNRFLHKEAKLELDLKTKSEETDMLASQCVAEQMESYFRQRAKSVYPDVDFSMINPEDDDTSAIVETPKEDEVKGDNATSQAEDLPPSEPLAVCPFSCSHSPFLFSNLSKFVVVQIHSYLGYPFFYW
ncbi:hypothetical protein U1Q18_004758 [Sarracenia purpurea var. burkii]